VESLNQVEANQQENWTLAKKRKKEEADNESTYSEQHVSTQKDHDVVEPPSKETKKNVFG